MLYIKIIGLLLLSSFSCFAKDVSLKEFIELAEKNDPKFKQIFSENDRLKYLADEALPTDQYLLSLSDEKGYGTGSNTNTSIQVGRLSKTIVKSGTEVSVSHSNSVQPGREEKTTSLRLEQALLKNSFGRDNRLRKSSLLLQQSLGELKVLESYEEYLLELADIYLSFKNAHQSVELANKVYEEAKKVSKNVSDKYKSNIASKTDLDRSKLLVLLRKEDVVSKEQELDLIKENLRRIVGPEAGNVKPSDKTENVFKFKDLPDSIKVDYTKLRKYEIAKSELEVSNKEATLKSRDSGMSLNLIAGYNEDQSQRFTTSTDRSETVIGLKLDIPFGDSKGQAATEIAYIEKYQNQLNLEIINSDMNKEIENINIQIKQIKKKIEINKQKVELTESILKDEEQRYKYGKISLDKLIETINSYATYRLDYQSNLVDYNKTVLKWYALSDQLINKKNTL